MDRLFVLACLVAVAVAAPKSHLSSSAHRRVTPARTNYKYLPTLEDSDEPVLGRQDAVNSKEPTSTLVPAPVVQPAKEVPPPGQTGVTEGRPVGVAPESVGKPVRPPPNRPFRPPNEPEKTEEDKEDDDSDEEDDESEEGDDENEDDDENDEDDEEDEEERKRQEKLPEKLQAVVKDTAPTDASVKTQTAPVSVESSVEDVQSVPSVESNEVASSAGLGVNDDIEALVPGYITEHGEVLVPVDTVAGDQHISIVPDIYTRQRHGIPHSYRNNPVYYESEDVGYLDY